MKATLSQQKALIKRGKEGCSQVFAEIPLDNTYYPGFSMIATALSQAHFNQTGHDKVLSTEPKYVTAILIDGKISLAYSKVLTS